MNSKQEYSIFWAYFASFMCLMMAGYAGITTNHRPLLEIHSEPVIAIDSPVVNLTYPIYNTGDPNSGNSSNLNLEDPLNFNNTVEYDPETGTYIFNNSVGNYNYNPSSSMSLEEYLDYDMENALQNNWQQIINDNSAAADNSGKSPIPTLHVGSGDKNFFGSNAIDIKPSGMAELKFGINTSRTDNPQIPEKQRKITVFDFDQKIQLNVVGSIGDKLKLNTSYNTEATFDFENIMKLEYKGNEDEIIQLIEAGNVNLPLTSQLIQGSQSLFGLKTQLKFGRLTATSVFSQQKGKRTEVEVSGGAQVSTFELTADNYEANKHYFLSHYFRNNFDVAMASLPTVNSQVNITRIEVWVTNNNNTVDNTRNIISFADLGETTILEGNPGGVVAGVPKNASNALYNFAANSPGVRGFNTATSTLNSIVTSPGPFQQSVHYEKVQNARKLTDQEYTYNAQLGFITLNQPLNNDEVLSVAYQYTYMGNTYQVGEFSTDGVAGQEALILKLLKGTVTNPRYKRWDLMMKNVYSIGAYQVNRENFQLNVWYNNPTSSVDINYIPQPGMDDKPLIQVINMDRYDQNNNPFADGVFDYVPITFSGNKSTVGGTINPQNGRIFFTTVEPFGKTLNDKLIAAGISAQTASTIVYQPLYDSTKTAAQQIPQLNRFKIKGTYQSSSSAEISLNTMNIPQGAVSVSAGGRVLVENQDYTVDYTMGRVKIINQGLLESQTPIKVSVESNTLFNVLTKTLLGTHFDYRVSKDINVGATVINLTERPLTQKINYGDEPVSNTMLGLNGDFRKEVPFLTRLVDKIPLISTKEKSTVTASAEYAHIIPGTARAINGISYIDDFEGSQSAIDIRSFSAWRLASVPKGQPTLFPEAEDNNKLSYGMNRAMFNWHVVDPLFYNNNNLTPDHIAGSPMQSSHIMRQVFEQEVFPNRQLATGQPTNIAMFDVSYWPAERGPYNYDTTGVPGKSNGLDLATGQLKDPETRWGGIMRQLQTTDFEAANIQFIQFWIMDPFNSDAVTSFGSTGGDLYFNLGNVSEDILSDSRKSFENGMPTSTNFDPSILDTTVWGRVATTQPIVNAFENSEDPNVRLMQDIGFDGLSSSQEYDFFSAYRNWINASIASQTFKDSVNNDPANDDYNYYRDQDYDAAQLDILKRYKRYNGNEGNSPTNEFSQNLNNDGYPTSASTIPDVEDINQDNNLSESESYFQYKVSIRPQDMVVGQNFITDALTKSVQMPDGSTKQITWYQFKIPINKYEKVINGISDFRSIRFIRMFMKDFEKPAIMRFARLELIRGEWRTYNHSLLEDGEYIQGDPDNTTFALFAVNIEENGNRVPVPYVLPPGINRQVDVSTANLRNLNEQSLAMEICGLEDGDSRACYRNVSFDIRSYKRLKMFVHAETSSQSDMVTKDNDVTLFIRLGTDFTENYYEYELPLKMTPWGSSVDTDIWPSGNEVDFEFEILKALKTRRNEKLAAGLAQVNELYIESDPNNSERQIKIIGNPNLQGLKIIMVGVRNPGKNGNNPYKPDDGLSKCLEVWINELRLTDFDQHGGWAAVGRVNANLADFANVSLSGNYSTPYWGSIEKKVSERSRETIIGFDGSTSVNADKFLPEKWGIKIPVYMGYSENIIKPQYDPLNPDLLLENSLAYMAPDEQEIYKRKTVNYTRRRSLNFTNVHKERGPKKKNAHFWDVENLSATYAYSEIYRRDINIEYNMNKTYRGGLNYAFNANPKLIEPFKENKFLGKSKWFGLVKDVNFYLGPKTFSVRNELNRTYTANQIRNNFDGLVFPTYTKNFTWVRAYDMKYDITRNLKVDFNANNNAVVGEPLGRVDKLYKDEYQVFKDSVRESLRTWGINKQYNHTVNINYTFPLSKLPLTDWITVTTRYSASYDWQRAPFGQDTLGNVIQNSRNVNWSGQLNLTTLYNKIPFLKKVNQKAQSGGGGKKPIDKGGLDPNNKKNPKEKENKEGEGSDTTKSKKPEKEVIFTFWETVARVGMSLKTVSVSFSTTDGIMLPGFGQTNNLMGMDYQYDSPGWGFVLGKQNHNLAGQTADWGGGINDYAFYAAENDWLIKNPYLNTQYTTNHSKNFSARTSIEPLTGLRIELNADKNFSENYSSFFRWVDTLGGAPYFDYAAQNPMTNGMMSMSTITWATSFAKDGENNVSPIFENFRNNRETASEILGSSNPNSGGLGNNEAGYYDGYGSTQQDVIISSFLAAYTGRNIDSKFTNPFTMTPLPNWKITFDPMAKTKIKFMKKRFKSFSISHGYRSTVNISNYSTNLLGTTDASGNINATDITGNFINPRLISMVSVSEQFSPLINIDITWNVKSKGQTNGLITKIEMKRDRNLSLSLTNNQVTEIRGSEFVVGSGYRFSKVKIGKIKIAGKPLESDLNCRVDLSIRNNATITRKVVENQNQATAGQQTISIKSSADYAINSKLTIRFYYDKVINRPVISTSFPTANTNSGIAIRFTL